MKLKIHSAVDLITNSSTTIFTYSEGSLLALKELVNEMLKTFEKTEKFDDIFYAEVFLEDNYNYIDFSEKLDLISMDYDDIERIKHQILTREIRKPNWMVDAEDYCDDNYRETVLEIIPKEEKYENIAKLLLRYLYSTEHEASYG